MKALTITCKLGKVGRGRRSGEAEPSVAPGGRVPRIARLLALAHRFDALLRDGVVRDQAELARFGHVSRARVTQIMNLLFLAPDIQESILFLREITRGRDRLTMRRIQPIALLPDWSRQRKEWEKMSVVDSWV